MTDLLQQIFDDIGSPVVTFLVGKNGSGKSRSLGEVATSLVNSGRRVIAVSNTTFDKFPRFRRSGYARISPSMGRRYAIDVFKRALLNQHSESIRNASLIARGLEYTGFSAVIGLHIRLRSDTGYEDLKRDLSDLLPDEELSQIVRAIDIYKNYGNRRQTAWIDLYGSTIGPDRRELFSLLRHEPLLKRLGIIQRISVTIQRESSLFDLEEASSGELSLICSQAYIASQIEEHDVILIDEPENSLHPKWQRDYCRRLLDQFHYYSPHLIVATHSPHIVQGAQNSEVNVRLIKLPKIEDAAEPLIKSIEGTLFEAFGVLSPASHYLSEKVTFILNELAQRRVELSQTQAELRGLREISDDPDQQAFLGRAIELALQVQNISIKGSAQS
jgi:hypothetical protein